MTRALERGGTPGLRAAPALQWVLFDLDGTLADTEPGLRAALNLLRHERGLHPLGSAAVRPCVSGGSRALLQLGLGVCREEAPQLLGRFFELYADEAVAGSRLFPGIDAALRTLEQHGLAWGVVTNKPGRFARPILAALGLQQRCACLVAGDDVAHAKPAPDPLLAACRMLGGKPHEGIYVGDARNDAVAAARAGMRSLTVDFGYLAADATPAEWGSEAVLYSPDELLAWLRGHS